MKTLYAACLSRLGLSQTGAAALHEVAVQSIKNWCSGRSRPPAGVWTELRAYEAVIVDRSEAIREAWEDAGEARDIDANVHGDPQSLMALADFVLTTDETPPVNVSMAG